MRVIKNLLLRRRVLYVKEITLYVNYLTILILSSKPPHGYWLTPQLYVKFLSMFDIFITNFSFETESDKNFLSEKVILVHEAVVKTDISDYN